MYPEAYLQYLIHFHGDRDFFECHEILEEHWKSQNKQGHHWVGLIQLAVGLYHERRENKDGAVRMLRSSYQILHKHSLTVEKLGLNADHLFELLDEQIKRIQAGASYQDIDLPIIDPELLHAVKQKAKRSGFTWLGSSNMEEPMLIHKHTLRPDRQEVIEERQYQKERKAKERQAQYV
ncbi:DUF309 domain-containing protein [Salsuginibacillus kocurii]|uniref:DUF309 domain-containing protein n=1 Tax=Salsuginibacillus kocurii TaxID=427078 RepID=UPI0003623DA1|nr:DUF309 domain-containing protein [Salsuginibacillus kocurii]